MLNGPLSEARHRSTTSPVNTDQFKSDEEYGSSQKPSNIRSELTTVIDPSINKLANHPAQHRHRHHRHQSCAGHLYSRHDRRKKIVQRLVIMVFLLFVLLTALYVWTSGGTGESSGLALPSQTGLIACVSCTTMS